MNTAIITGANGFIGAHLVFRLLNQGWCIHALGRSTQTTPWEDRVGAAAREVGSVKGLPGRQFCHEVDVSSPPQTLGSFLDGSPQLPEPILFHVAGDTQFRPHDPEAQRQINIQGPLNLARALKGRISRMIHVSTAYVAGTRTGLVREDELDCGQGFWNSYEKSKFDAEAALKRLCEQEGIPLVIVRPSIIINDRKTGRASTFTHLNALVEVVTRLQEYYNLADGEVVSKTIRLLVDAKARPNLAAVDSIILPLLQIADSPAALGKIFHLCHPKPQTNAEILGMICEAYNVSSRLALDFVDRIVPPLSHTEEMVARSLKVYSPYLNSRVEFDLSNTRSVVPDYDSYFSPLDVAFIRKVVEFQRKKHQERRSG